MAENVCATCGTANRDGRKFYAQCGGSLVAAPRCPGCGAQNEPGERFCGECGRSLGESSTPAPG